jgi:hypothetical protein
LENFTLKSLNCVIVFIFYQKNLDGSQDLFSPTQLLTNPPTGFPVVFGAKDSHKTQP